MKAKIQMMFCLPENSSEGEGTLSVSGDDENSDNGKIDISIKERFFGRKIRSYRSYPNYSVRTPGNLKIEPLINEIFLLDYRSL